jgi:hypothetical protein
VIEKHHAGVEVFATGAYRSPIPAIRADQAREFKSAPDRWAHQFAGWLQESPLSPVHRGEWILRARPGRQPASSWLRNELVRDYPESELDWFGQGWQGILPLRKLSGPDASRVKAYRKLVRDRVLPPVLLMWASCVNGYVLLDGHDRLTAALAEDTEPPFLILHRTPADRDREQTTKWVMEGHEKVTRSLDNLGARLAGEPAGKRREFEERKVTQARNRQDSHFGRTLVDIDTEMARTVAWQHPGGSARWEVVAESIAPRWLGTLRRHDLL